jgi:hypothetical protein
LVHDEERKVATDELDPRIEPRPHAGVLFEAGAIQTRRRLYSGTVTARRTADARKRQQRNWRYRPEIDAGVVQRCARKPIFSLPSNIPF